MGQTIQIWDASVVADVLLVSTDRSFTGQDGETYRPGSPIEGDPVAPGAIFPAQLATRLFQSDPAIDHVYVMSNVLSIRRRDGWDDGSVASIRDLVASFFLFYEAQPGSETQSPEAEKQPAETPPAAEQEPAAEQQPAEMPPAAEEQAAEQPA